mmetsp:Transcript_6528/g.11433  ORF Transcript_6528/g.11433 Transcript_6528/m.11433 type:complete len:167 (+) Transcript_6528:27-527(+)
MKSFAQFDMPPKIDPKRNRFPYCIVWTPLPLITALFPFIGHTGICTSDGTIHDFSGPYTITVDDFAFGDPVKYVEMEYSDAVAWDNAVTQADREYSEMNYNIFTNNCHSHIARAFNLLSLEGKHWNMVKVWWVLSSRSKYVSFWGVLKAYKGWIIIGAICSLFSLL